MTNYTSGSASDRNFDDLDIEGSNAEDFLEPQIKKKKTPEEIHLLKHCTVELDDGRHGYVFSYEEDKTGTGVYFCHICQSSLATWVAVNQHISGKKHSTGMQKSYHPRVNFSRIVEEQTTVELQPGEPAPPGMEDMVEPKKCIIQSKLDAFKSKPLIGLEYLIEQVGNLSEPKYFCLLCNKQGVNNTILTHLSSQLHYLKYLQKYFMTVYNALMLVPKTPEYKKGYSVILTRIVSRIESKFGRLKPRQSHTDSNQKIELLNIIEKEFHFRETPQDDYVNMVDWTEMKRLQFYNEDDDVVPVSNEPALNSNLEKDTSNKSLFNKAGRINVDKRQLRKDRESLDCDDKGRENSPDLIIIGESKKPSGDAKKVEADRKSLSSISSISSVSSASERRSRSRSKSRSSFRERRRSPMDSRYRHHSRSRSPSGRKRHTGSRYPYSRSRSRSRSSSKRYPYRGRSRSTSRPRYMRHKRDYSPVLPYPKRRRRSISRSRSRSPRSISPSGPVPRYLRYRYGKPNYKSKKDSKTTSTYKWEKFRDDMRVFAKELDEKLKYYEKNPEKHPQYPEEWKMFWNRRYKELQAEGKDPAKHDFKPEWITFWNKRMKEIHDEEFKSGKEKIKLQVGLRDEEKGELDRDKTENLSVENRTDVTVDDIKNTWRALTGSEIKEGNKSPPSSINEDSEPFPREHFESRRSHLISRQPPPGVRQGFIPFDDNAPRVISVLRMISVLESQLGSLGPKIVDLLSKAIAMEKTCPGSSQDILCDEEQCVLFETVKEKLKGMLYAGLVDRNFVNMTKVALRNIEDLFLSAPKVSRKERPSYIAPVPAVVAPTPAPAAAPVTVPGVGTVDRMAIAQQIAGALIAQGKTDVTEDELEQLINAVVGMAQASSSSATPITTAQYIKQAQNLVSDASDSNVAASEGLKLLQAAYDEDENKGNSDRNPDSPIMTKPSIDKATDSLNNSLKELSDKDLKCLLNNFKELKADEKSKFITYFKKLESSDPERISSLQKSINIKALLGPDADKISSLKSGDQVLFYPGKSGAAVSETLKNDDTDDDDDDYSVDDVYKAASEKLRQQEMTQERKKIESMLADIAEAAKKGEAIANLTASFQIPGTEIPSNKSASTSVEVQQPPSGRPMLGEFDKTSQSYTQQNYQHSSFQLPINTHNNQLQNNCNTFDKGPAQPYNYNINPNIFPGNIQPEKGDQFRCLGDGRLRYPSGMNNRQPFPHNRDVPFPKNNSNFNRFPSQFHNRFEPPPYGQERPRHFNNY